MTKEELEKLYKNQVLPESKNPYHFSKVENADLIIKANNPMCGDKFEIYLQIDDDRIKQVHFQGFGCAISKASTSILSKTLEGMALEEAKQLCAGFMNAVKGTENSLDIKDEQINTLIALKDFEGRMDCVKLSWEAVKNS